jgi:hypothetical protein
MYTKFKQRRTNSEVNETVKKEQSLNVHVGLVLLHRPYRTVFSLDVLIIQLVLHRSHPLETDLYSGRHLWQYGNVFPLSSLAII